MSSLHTVQAELVKVLEENNEGLAADFDLPVAFNILANHFYDGARLYVTASNGSR